MTKTAYADRMSDEDFTELTKDMSPEDRELVRSERLISPLFDMWLRFETAFARRAIDQLDVSDDDAELAAQRMEKSDTGMGRAFAYLLRHIAHERRVRELFYKVSAVWAAAGTSDPLSIPEVHERYAKLPKGDA